MTAQRTFVVMRHAKAGELPGGPDMERPLRPRGCRDAAAAGRWLAERGTEPDRVLCSPARRTRQTWQYAGAELGGCPEVVTDPGLYEATAAEALAIISEYGGEAGTLMYVGHNPAAAQIAGMLLGHPVRFPTAAVVIAGLRVAWTDLAMEAGEPHAGFTARWEPGQGHEP